MKIMLMLMIALVSGCTTVEWGDVKYARFGGQELESMSITRLENGDVLVELNKYKSENIGPLASGIAEGVVRGMR